MMECVAGLDVAPRSCALRIVDARGAVAFQRALACDVCEITKRLARFPRPIILIGFEAGR
ncbi:hypothetical protein BWR18_02350 [Tateyamaria omphalii]|uniref:IS110 family transposase n=1 Tax=Tateyamaria omphalii TaxID=299262 RepID=A0A1P8MRL2_9RHOB|nr:hypothetical protein BWR18_02350 [Tateyamaria omphalii]